MTGTPTPPPAPAPFGFDIYITRGTSSITSFTPDPETGEYPNAGPASWSSVQLDIRGGEPELIGYRYAMVYWVREDTPDGQGGTTYTKTFPAWRLVSQTIVKSSPSREVFYTNLGTELFPSLPQPQDVVGGAQTTAGGITDGTKYAYLKVFDEAQLEWLPRCSTYKQKVITKGMMPDGEVKPELPFPWYPMDTVTALVPDERENLTITYTVTTQYQVGNPLTGIIDENAPVQTYSFNITQECTQDPNITEGDIKAILDKCYFTHGFQHIQLYEVKAPPNYDEYGIPIGEVKEPEYSLNEEQTESVGFNVYDLENTVWVYNKIDKVPEYEADSEIVLDDTVAEGIEQTKDYSEIIAITQKQYEEEINSIEKVQKENADVISVNEERRIKLLGNIKNLITQSPDSFFDESK